MPIDSMIFLPWTLLSVFYTDVGLIGAIVKLEGYSSIEIVPIKEGITVNICIDCDGRIAPRFLRCSSCRRTKRCAEAKIRYRQKHQLPNIETLIICVICQANIPEAPIDRKYCDDCRQLRLNELKRVRRADNPEKYRAKDRAYKVKSGATKVQVANRRARKHGASVVDLKTINRVFQADNYTCQYCYERGGDLTVDHITPLCNGGANNESNLVTACRTCNMSKGPKSLLEFLLYKLQKSLGR
jgi:5-methylcytosine-specific restriction endonuclease McrA